MSATLLCGDALTILKTLPDGAARCCVTSPPYWGLRDYGVAGQLGLEPTPDEYVAKMVAVFREVRRVLADDGTLFLNIGDSYMSQGGERLYGSYDGATGRGPSTSRRRANACGISGTTLEGSQERGCLCGSLCGACRAAYRIGRSHSDVRHVPTPSPSPSAPSRERREFGSDHSPTSDSALQETRNASATADQMRSECPAPELPASSAVSMPGGSSLRHPEDFPRLDMLLACRLCGCSSIADAQPSGDMMDCTCGIASPSDASGADRSGTVSSDSSYPNLAIASPKVKDLVGIPWRLAFALQADGWFLRSDIIWSKPNPMPESVTDRPTKAHEYVFLLSKRARYFYDAAAIAEEALYPDGPNAPDKIASPMGQGFTRRADKQRGHSRRHAGFNDRWDAMERAQQCSGYRNARSVWSIATQPYPDAHFATFPEELARRCILAGSAPSDTVLDPFGGSGTVAQVATGNGRQAIHIDLNPAYIELARQRIGPLLLSS